MGRITLLETTGYLRLRLEKLLAHYNFNDTEILDSLINKNVRYTFRHTDLAILDLDNHKMDVVSIIEELKRDERLKSIEIILLSSQSDIKTLKKAIQAGCTEFVTKPFSDELLIEKIHKLTQREFKNKGLPHDFNSDQDMNGGNFSWQKDYEIGIEEIDAEHKMIIDSYEKLYTYMKAGKGHSYYQEIVGFLEKYVNEHFAHEEAFQERINYDNKEEHKAYHIEFKEKIGQIIKDHNEKAATDMDLIRINLFLKDWLLQHILVEDAKIGLFIKNQGL